MVRASLAALFCSAALLVSGCDSGQSEDKANQWFTELMQRPDIERAQASYLAMLERIQRELVDQLGIAPFPPDEDEPISASACPGDLSLIPDAEVRRYQFGASKGNISDAEWPRALALVTEVAAQNGFDRVNTVIDRPGDHEVAITDRLGAELIFGTAKNTIVSLSTGCHLSREAHERGTPSERRSY